MREEILKRVREANADCKKPTPYPDWDGHIEALLPPRETAWDTFCGNLEAASGIALQGSEALIRWLEEAGYTHGYCDPDLLPHLGALPESFVVTTEYNPAAQDNYQFGITRATAVIAETGTIILQDSDTSNRLGALAPWVHVAVLTSHQQILPDVTTAVAQLGTDPNIIWVTGPSKTADVEGVLIEGVHGPGIQICVDMS